MITEVLLKMALPVPVGPPRMYHPIGLCFLVTGPFPDDSAFEDGIFQILEDGSMMRHELVPWF